MTESDALKKMIAPGTRRRGKYREGVIQIWTTRACDLSCFGCTQGSNLAGKPGFISVENFEVAVKSLEGYFGVVGVFGGNPALHPEFEELCRILRKYVPRERRGLWSNSPRGKGKVMRETFDPSVSNLNVHLSREAYDEFKRDWPESNPVGLTKDSRHSPPYVAIKDVLRKECSACAGSGFDSEASARFREIQLPPGYEPEIKSHGANCRTCGGKGTVPDEEAAYDLISNCDINRHWSAMIGQFRGQPRAWFCEIAGAQAMLRQDEPDYPDTGIELLENGDYVWAETRFWDKWWQLPMSAFAHQVRRHCLDCGVPLRGYGALAQGDEKTEREQTSETYAALYRPKRPGRSVELVTRRADLGKPLGKMTDYLGNASK